MRKVIFLANYDWYLYNFKLALAEAVRDAGFDVVLATPPGDYAERFAAHGFRWVSFPMSRHGLNPLREAATVLRLVRLYRRERPFLAHQFTAKAVIYGSIAARLAGPSRRINAITGGASAMGTVIEESGWRMRALRRALRGLLGFSLRDSEVIFQNPDDLGAFVSGGVVPTDRVHLIRGSGVDPEQFPVVTPPPGSPVVVLASRLLRNKGVHDFVEAARITLARGVEARFALVGEPDPGNPMSVTSRELEDWVREGVVETWGFQSDMPAVFARSHVVCLPSVYSEGVPKVLIEAACSGLPVVATDRPGCREIVRDGENGRLVPAGDPARLADALVALVGDGEARRTMGMRGRRIVEEEFSLARVIDETLAVYGKFTGDPVRRVEAHRGEAPE